MARDGKEYYLQWCQADKEKRTRDDISHTFASVYERLRQAFANNMSI